MPKPFAFKLEKVLDFRLQLEEQAKAELNKAQQAHDDQARVVRQLTEQLTDHMTKEQASRTSANEMWLWRQYKQALEGDLSGARYALSELELNLHQRRQEAVAKSRDKKLLEKLKETQAKKHHEEESAREEKENDEMATIRFQSEDI